MQLGVHATLGSANQTTPLVIGPPFFYPKARSRAVRLEVGRVRCLTVDCKAINEKGASPSSEPPPRTRGPPSFGQRCLCRPIASSGCRGSWPGHTPSVASHQRKPLRLMKIMPLNTRPLSRFAGKPLPGNGSSTRGLAMALWEERLKAGHPRVCQPEKAAHLSVSLRSLNQANNIRSKGPDPRPMQMAFQGGALPPSPCDSPGVFWPR